MGVPRQRREGADSRASQGQDRAHRVLGHVVRTRVRAMPRIQGLHARFKDRGLKVLGVSYEALDVTKPFFEKNGYSFALGSDPAKRVVGAFGVHSWPTSIVIDEGGQDRARRRSVHGGDGSREGARTRDGPAEAVHRGARRPLLEGREEDQGRPRARCREVGGRARPEGVGDRGRGRGRRGIPAGAEGIRRPGRGRQARAGLGGEGRRQEEGQSRHPREERPRGVRCGPLGPARIREGGSDHQAEITELLKAQRYDDAVDALYLRAPAGPVVASCASDKGLKEYSAKRAAEARTEAKKAIMCVDYAFLGELPRNNMDFWKELSVSGWRTSKDQKRMTGVLLGDGDATPSNAGFYADVHFARAFIMESLAAGKEPQVGTLAEKIGKDREALRKQLASKYSWVGHEADREKEMEKERQKEKEEQEKNKRKE